MDGDSKNIVQYLVDEYSFLAYLSDREDKMRVLTVWRLTTHILVVPHR